MGERNKVIITDYATEPLELERGILGDVAEVIALGAGQESELAGRIEDADAIMTYHFLRIGAETIARLEKCKLIVRCGVGVDNVDGAAARARGIPLANVPDYGTEEVADSAIGLALSLARGTHFLNSRLRRGEGPWSPGMAKPLHRLRGRVFGVVGIGRIGTATALRAKALGFDVVFYDPYVPDGREKSLGVTRVDSLGELMRQSDVVSLHCPLTEETRHMIDADALSQMKPGGYVVNTARGRVVDAQAVLDSVTDGHLFGAALDVLEKEPPDDGDPLIASWRDPDHPAHDRIILCPHAAFYSEEGLDDMRIKGSENCRRVLLGQQPRNVMN